MSEEQYIEVGFDDEDDDVDELVEVDMLEQSGETEGDPLVFPCVVLYGAKFFHEMQFIANIDNDESCSVPLFVVLEDNGVFVRKRLGNLELTAYNLCNLRYLNNDYQLVFCPQEGVQTELGLDYESLLRFIKIKR